MQQILSIDGRSVLQRIAMVVVNGPKVTDSKGQFLIRQLAVVIRHCLLRHRSSSMIRIVMVWSLLHFCHSVVRAALAWLLSCC